MTYLHIIQKSNILTGFPMAITFNPHRCYGKGSSCNRSHNKGLHRAYISSERQRERERKRKKEKKEKKKKKKKKRQRQRERERDEREVLAMRVRVRARPTSRQQTLSLCPHFLGGLLLSIARVALKLATRLKVTILSLSDKLGGR